MPSEANATTATAAKLRAKIFKEQWKRDQALPSEAALCKSMGVSRTTMRQAVSMLISEGLLEVKNGVGAKVRNFYRTGSLEMLGHVLASAEGDSARELTLQVLALGETVLVMTAQKIVSQKVRQLPLTERAIDDLKRAIEGEAELGEVLEREETVFYAIASDLKDLTLMLATATISRALEPLRQRATRMDPVKSMVERFEALADALRKGDKKAPAVMAAVVTSRDKLWVSLSQR